MRRLLEVGEIIKDGDKYWMSDGWQDTIAYGLPIQASDPLFCREEPDGRAEMLELLESWLDEVEIPDTNCSCHKHPPCNDCVDFSCLRELAATTKKVITKAKESKP